MASLQDPIPHDRVVIVALLVHASVIRDVVIEKLVFGFVLLLFLGAINKVSIIDALLFPNLELLLELVLELFLSLPVNGERLGDGF